MIKKIFSYKSDRKYITINILGIKITIKKNIYKEFIKHKIPDNSVLIIEFNPYHGETLPGFIKYFEDLNYNIDILIDSTLYKDKALSNFNYKKLNKIFVFNKFDIINNILLFPVIKKYNIVFFNSYVFTLDNKRQSIFVYKEKVLDNMNKYICVEHNAFYDFERNIDKNRTVTLLPNSFCSKYINPHYYFEKKLNNKNKITKFAIFAREENSLKNIQLLIDSVKKIIDIGINNFNLILVGRINKLNIDITGYEKYIAFTGYLDYESLYKEVQLSDFILPMLDPNIEDHKRFLEDVSGTFQLIYGFGKIPIIHSFFSYRYGFNKENALIYNNNDELVESIKYAINMTNDEYLKKSKMIFEYSDILYKESLENLKYMSEN